MLRAKEIRRGVWGCLGAMLLQQFSGQSISPHLFCISLDTTC